MEDPLPPLHRKVIVTLTEVLVGSKLYHNKEKLIDKEKTSLHYNSICNPDLKIAYLMFVLMSHSLVALHLFPQL